MKKVFIGCLIVSMIVNSIPAVMVQADTKVGGEKVVERNHVEGEGIGINGEIKKLNLNYVDGKYYLQDVSGKGTVTTKEYKEEEYMGFDEMWDDTEIPSSDTNKFEGESNKVLVEANSNIKKVIEYYKKNFNRYSYDNKDGELRVIVNWKDSANAQYIPGKNAYIILGDGNAPWMGIKLNNLATNLDIVAHEYSHAVVGSIPNVQDPSNPNHAFQDMAINESFADIFAYLIEGVEDDWVIGNGLSETPGPYKRCLDNPKSTGHNDHVSQLTGEFHQDSTILSKAFSIVSKKIGRTNASKIYYDALTKYLYYSSNFWDVRDAVLLAAKDNFGDKYNGIIKDAYDEVGIEGENIKSTPVKYVINAKQAEGYYYSYKDYSIEFYLDKGHNIDELQIIKEYYGEEEKEPEVIVDKKFENNEAEFKYVDSEDGKGGYTYTIITKSGNVVTRKIAEAIQVQELPEAVEWKNNTEYKEDELVRYFDKVYICIKSHTSTNEWNPNFGTSLWKEI